MKIYVCSICGYVYEESKGIPDKGIDPETKWEDLPVDWVCPLCMAGKDSFTLKEVSNESEPPSKEVENISDDSDDKTSTSFSNEQLSAIFANLSKGCEKQYLVEESEFFKTLSTYWDSKIQKETTSSYDDLISNLKSDIESMILDTKSIAKSNKDRGALRALTWVEKVSNMVQSALNNRTDSIEKIAKGENVYVCEICGFVMVSDEPPEVCPVCKVPKSKISKVGR